MSAGGFAAYRAAAGVDVDGNSLAGCRDRRPALARHRARGDPDAAEAYGGRMAGPDDGWTLRHLDLATHRIANALDRCGSYS
jgi:hypothetical protein